MATRNGKAHDLDLDDREMSEAAQTQADGDKINSPTNMGTECNTKEAACRESSPRRVRDIHLDGSADNMPAVDPYMLDDKDLDIHSEVDVNAGSVYSDLSGPSWKSLRTPRLKPHSASSSAPRSSIASRARQMKNHEGEPFLSIDLMPQMSATKSEPKQTGQLRSPLRGSSCQTLISAVSSESITQRSGKNIARTGKPRVLSATSSYLSPVKDSPKPNQHVKMPFKQSSGSKGSVRPVNSSPSQGLTERTAMATHVFNKILKEQKPSKTTYVQGRLLKARLKPLEPVHPSGPTIHQCRGIMTETRTYGQSQSRTFQRWKAIMAGGATAHQHLHHPHLPAGTLTDVAMANGSNGVIDPRDIRSGSVCESVHQTSQASSSPSPTPRDLLNPDFDEDELDYVQDSGVPLSGRVEGTVMDGVSSEMPDVMEPRALTSGSTPGLRHCDEDLASLQGPDLQGITPVASRLGVTPGEDLNTTDDAVNTSQDAAGVAVLPCAATTSAALPSTTGTENYGSESVISGSTSFQPSDKGDNSSTIQQAAAAASPGSKRPQSASYLQKPVAVQPASRRPKTAVDSASRKAVRFADESVPSTQLVNAKQEGSATSSAKTKSSCRPRSLDSGFHDRDDPEDDHGGGNRASKTFLTQQPVLTANGGATPTHNSSQQNGRSGSGHGKKAAVKHSSSHPQESSSISGTKPEISAEGVRASTLQEIYGLKPASLTYLEDLGRNQMQRKRPKNSTKQSKAPKAGVSNIKQKLDDRFAMYQKLKEAKSKENGSKKSNQKHTGQVFKETEDKQGSEGDVDDREPFDKDTELKQVVKKFFKPVDFVDKPERRVKSQNSQSRKAKALKVLQAKTNTRPFSASTYSDQIVSGGKSAIAKVGKDLRPKSAETFSEKTQILSKHGLLKSHNIIGSTSQRPTTGSYVLTVKSNDPLSSDVVQLAGSHQSDDDEQQSTLATLSEARATYSVSSRPKSGSRVTFAANPGNSCLSSAKRPQGRRVSAVSQDSGRTTLSGVDDDGILDADMMWAELSTDDSDDDMRGSNGGRELVTEEDFFMAKFDLLDMQFEAAKAELRQDKLKSALKQRQTLDTDDQAAGKSLVPHCQALRSTDQDDRVTYLNNETAGRSPRYLPCSQSVFHTHSDPAAVHEPLVPDSHGTNARLEESQQPVQHQERPEMSVMSDHQKQQLPGETQLSSQLYRKTNVYVPTSSRQRVRPSSASRPKRLSCGDEKMSVQEEEKLQNKTQNEEVKEKDDACVAKSTDSTAEAKIEDQVKESETRKLETQQEMQRDYPMLLGVKVELQAPAETQRSAKTSCEGVRLRAEGAGVVEENVGQYESYQEMLLAYRRHCIEGSDKSDSELDSDTFTRLAQPKKVELQAPAETQRSAKTSCEDVRFGAEGAGVVEENVGQYESFQEMLLAYRRHCIEGSDKSDSESDSDTFTRLAQPKKVHTERSQPKSALRHSKVKVIRDKKAEKDGKAVKTLLPKKVVSTTRPISATTNDSGWESDSEPPSPGLDLAHGETTLTFSHSAATVALSPSESNKSQTTRAASYPEHPVHSASVGEGSLLGTGKKSEQPQDKSQDKKTSEEFHVRTSPGLRPAQTTSDQDSSDKGPLAVVAHAKKLSKKPCEEAEGDPMSMLCEAPPMCFKLNARPPEGFLYYFAYGPNMSRDRLCTYLQCENPPSRFWALLFGFSLVFNKKGSGTDVATLGGFPNLEYNPASSVEGCIFQLTSAQLDRLDAYMDYPRTQEHVVLPVWMSNCSSPDFGVAQYCVPAVTYIAQNDATWTDPVKANEFSVNQCRKAASETCSGSYQDHLASFSSNTAPFTGALAITAS